LSTSPLVLAPSWGGCPPLLLNCPPYERTLGPEAVELYRSAGGRLDDWQECCVHGILAIDGRGRWVCFECGVVVARQNGKGNVLECLAMAGLYLLGERLIMWSAHEYKTAMEGFRRTLGLIEGTDDLRRRVKRVSRTNGDEGIELHGEGRHKVTGGQRLRFVARSKGSGRGFTGVRNLIDESYAYTEDQKAALMPTMSAVEATYGTPPQIVYTSSPPLDALTGDPMFDLRDRAVAGDPDLFWADWGAPLDAEKPEDQEKARDPKLWLATNPAAPHRVSMEHIGRELRGMGIAGFMRERLCVWPRRAATNAIDFKAWQGLVDVCAGEDCDEWVEGMDKRGRCRHEVIGGFAFAFDVSEARDYAAIAAVGRRADGLEHWEVAVYRPGTDWVVDRLTELKERHAPIAFGLDQNAPANTLVADLVDEELGDSAITVPLVEEFPLRGDLLLINARQVAMACGDMVDAVRQGRGRHLGQGVLDLAVQKAEQRPAGDGFTWGRRLSSVDVSPFVALTLARHTFTVRAPLVPDESDGDPGAWYL
jgi:hypothetical protein